MGRYVVFYHYIYINCCNNQALLYNLLDGDCLVEDNPELFSAILGASQKAYYGFEVTDTISSKKSFISFMQKVRKLMFGELVEKQECQLPLVFRPVIDIKGFSLEDEQICFKSKNDQDINYFKHRMGNEIVDNLYEMNLYLTSTSNVSEYRFAYKQYSYPFFSKSMKTIDFDWLKRELSFDLMNLNSLNIVIGEIEEQNKLELFDFILEQSKYNKLNIYMLKKQFDNHKMSFLHIDNVRYFLWISDMSDILDNSSFDNLVLLALVRNGEEYECFHRYIKKLSCPMIILPYFDRKNKDFCVRKLSYTISELLSTPYKHNEIVANSILNANLFGTISILPDGNVFSDINVEKLMVLDNNITIKDILFKELAIKRNWFFVRKKVKPCNKCVFMNICPPVTNVEHFMKKYDFCIK